MLTAAGYDVLTSLAGRVSAPALPVGRVRIGGFGGVDGLSEFLSQHHIAAVVDATHPFAAQISANAEQAAARSGRPLLRLARPGWRTTHGPTPGPGWPTPTRPGSPRTRRIGPS